MCACLGPCLVHSGLVRKVNDMSISCRYYLCGFVCQAVKEQLILARPIGPTLRPEQWRDGTNLRWPVSALLQTNPGEREGERVRHGGRESIQRWSSIEYCIRSSASTLTITSHHDGVSGICGASRQGVVWRHGGGRGACRIWRNRTAGQGQVPGSLERRWKMPQRTSGGFPTHSRFLLFNISSHRIDSLTTFSAKLAVGLWSFVYVIVRWPCRIAAHQSCVLIAFHSFH